jgi:hypothetical protein
MRFFFGDVVELNHEFYGKVKGIVNDFSYDSDYDEFNKRTKKFSKSDSGYSYMVIIALKQEIGTREILVNNKVMKLIKRDELQKGDVQ